MAIKKHVQLIDKIDLPAGVILNFWDLNERTQISVEIDNPTGDYVIGEVFAMDRTAKTEDLALERSNAHIDSKDLLIPRKKARDSDVPRRFVIRKAPFKPLIEAPVGKKVWRGKEKQALLPLPLDIANSKGGARGVGGRVFSAAPTFFSGRVIK